VHKGAIRIKTAVRGGGRPLAPPLWRCPLSRSLPLSNWCCFLCRPATSSSSKQFICPIIRFSRKVCYVSRPQRRLRNSLRATSSGHSKQNPWVWSFFRFVVVVASNDEVGRLEAFGAVQNELMVTMQSVMVTSQLYVCVLKNQRRKGSQN